MAAAWIALGMFIWSITEYMCHRFIFHGEFYWLKHMPYKKYFITLHFTMHGYHHAYPTDPYRLALPPLLAFIYYT